MCTATGGFDEYCVRILSPTSILSGKNYVHQLKLILNLFGAPSPEDIEMVAGRNEHIRDFLATVQHVSTPTARDVSTCIDAAAHELVKDEGVDLLRQMVRFR